jgi:hypothetical protein
MSTKLIRNSTAEFLIFTGQAGEQSIEARYEDNSIWLTQKVMAELFQVQPQNITQHLKNIYAEGEVQEAATCKDFLQVRTEGGRQVKRQQKHYNLDAIISVGNRVNSLRATQFRQWATRVLRDFAIKGFFATVQNKLHFAIHGHTAAELVKLRADSNQPNMGLTSWAKGPDGKILKTDVSNAKNYLSKDELGSLGRIVNAYLELAEDRATRKIPMTMEDWAKRLDAFLQFDERDILQDNGNVSASIAKEHAESEFEKYRIVQDRLYTSDFDKLVKTTAKAEERH